MKNTKQENIWELSARLRNALQIEDYKQCAEIKKKIDSWTGTAPKEDMILIDHVKESKHYKEMNNVFQNV